MTFTVAGELTKEERKHLCYLGGAAWIRLKLRDELPPVYVTKRAPTRMTYAEREDRARKAAARHHGGESASIIAKQLGVSREAIHAWSRKYAPQDQ